MLSQIIYWKNSSKLSARKADRTVGRPAVSNRDVLGAIPYVLRSVCQWKEIPREEYTTGEKFLKNTRPVLC